MDSHQAARVFQVARRPTRTHESRRHGQQLISLARKGTSMPHSPNAGGGRSQNPAGCGKSGTRSDVACGSALCARSLPSLSLNTQHALHSGLARHHTSCGTRQRQRGLLRRGQAEALSVSTPETSDDFSAQMAGRRPALDCDGSSFQFVLAHPSPGWLRKRRWPSPPCWTEPGWRRAAEEQREGALGQRRSHATPRQHATAGKRAGFTRLFQPLPERPTAEGAAGSHGGDQPRSS